MTSKVKTFWSQTVIVIAYVLILIGSLCFALTLYAEVMHTFGMQGVSTVEWPLREVLAIDVDSQGRIYCVNRVYGRLQIFDANGQFIRGWSLPTITFNIEPTNNLIHAVTWNDKNIEYDLNGNIIRQWDEKGSYANFPTRGDFGCKDIYGNRYRRDSAYLPTTIVKITPSGIKTAVVTEPLYLWLLGFPLPAGIYWLIAIVIFETRRRMKKQFPRAIQACPRV